MKRYFRAGEDSLVGQVEHVVESRLERSRRAVDRFTTVCKAHPRVIAAFLGGSIAAGTADEQSDIDVYLLTRQNDYEEFFQDRERFLRSWSGIAWWKDHRDFEGLGFDMMLFLMKDGVDGELALAHEGNFRRTHGGPHVVLVDKVGLLNGVKFPLLHFEDVTKKEDVENGLTEFWLETRGAIKTWSRNKLWESAESLVRMRRRCRTFSRIIHASDTEERLAPTYSSLDKDRISDGIMAAVEAYMTWAPEAAKKTGAAFPTQLAQLGRQRVRAVLEPLASK